MEIASPTVREGLLQEPAGELQRCLTCERRCELVDGATGWCRTRFNRSGRIYTSDYGNISSISANPIEKKPLYHVYPGSHALTMGGWSCNFDCPWCQNWHITKYPPPEPGRYMSPRDFVDRAIQLNCRGTSISFNEPTLSLEWSLDVFRLAREAGLYNTYVTNGYMTEYALHELIESGLDAMNVDIKGTADAVHKYCKGIDVEKVWSRCLQSVRMSIHLEITTLIITGVNDSQESLAEIAQRIADELGDEIPWHVSAYHPAYHFEAPPTDRRALETACEVGQECGLKYIYMGNLPINPREDTLCPSCGRSLVKRKGYAIMANQIQHGKCPDCGLSIPGLWD